MNTVGFVQFFEFVERLLMGGAIVPADAGVLRKVVAGDDAAHIGEGGWVGIAEFDDV
jgi:hypothetical protein